MPQTSVDANVKEDEESDVDDEGILKPKILAFEDSVLMDFQASHPDVLLKIYEILQDPDSIDQRSLMLYRGAHEMCKRGEGEFLQVKN